MTSIRKTRFAFVATLGVTVAFGFFSSLSFAQFRDLDRSPTSADDTEPARSLLPIQEGFEAPVIDQAPSQTEAGSEDDLIVQPVPMPEIAESIPNRSTASSLPDGKSRSLVNQPPTTDIDPMSAFADRSTSANADQEPDIRIVEFNGVRVGLTTVTELRGAWGKPTSTLQHDDASETLIYHVPSFRQVDVAIKEQIVTGILVHLEQPISVAEVQTELKLSDVRPVPIPDLYGEVLGQAYPERGLLFSFHDDFEDLRVAAVLIEPISAEMFRLRAQYDFDHRYLLSIADLEYCIQLDSSDAAAHWLLAELLDAVGRCSEGKSYAEKAVELKPTNPSYRLTRARFLAKFEEHTEAIDEVKSIISEMDLPNELAARAHCLLGDLLAMGPVADYQEALNHHLKAIDLGAKSIDSDEFGVRRLAKHTLVDAHLSVARDIATGNFQKQSKVVPKWLLRASEMVEEFISSEHDDEVLNLYVFRDTLAAYAELQQSSFNAVKACEEALNLGKTLIADTNDSLFKVQIERLLAEILLHAAKIERAQEKYDRAIKYANNSLALLENSSDHFEQVSHDHYLKGQLLFLIGTIYAVRDDDHDEATSWYAKAANSFLQSDFISPLYTDRAHGEMYVSMGLSFWNNNSPEKAIQLTEAGATLMEQAVKKGSLPIAAMAIPYGNLATMHGKQGNSDQSLEYAKLVASCQKKVSSDSTTIR